MGLGINNGGKMKKIILFSILCFLLTGCTLNYELEISDENFYETISGNVLKSEIEPEENQTDVGPYNFFLNTEQPVFRNNNKIFYNKTLNENENKIEYEYSYTFNENNFANSNLLNECFDVFNLENDNNKIYLTVAGNFKCAYAEKTNINIITDYKVIAHNGNKNKNKYTWTINKEKTDNLTLFITIDKSEKTTKIEGPLGWSGLKTIGLIILAILCGIALYIAKKKLKD